VKAFIVNYDDNKTAEELTEVKKLLLHRHIAWLYKLRSQLLEPTSWEHVSLRGPFGRDGREKMKRSGLGLYGDDITDSQVRHYLPAVEYSTLSSFKNAAAQMIDKQSQELAGIRRLGYITEFEHIKLQGVLDDFYDHQGKAERIKKTPFPRQFGSYGFIMICLFIVILPFGFFSEFNKIGNYGIWLAIPFIIVISWVYILMELVGDYSENPFEGLENDVPMLSICRNIEIDLLQQLGESSLPQPIQSVNNVLM